MCMCSKYRNVLSDTMLVRLNLHFLFLILLLRNYRVNKFSTGEWCV